ncbi:heavy-metal-associated domain-containing protein [Leisingera aquimarina]|uniref:heavy-metal-associated domain-containing protein n=2 Tax=Leisingera TaxID=191028 RepID=UPI001B7FADC6|nr:heavy-metal-associated domain-containing protein [Leisingera aquimarina]
MSIHVHFLSFESSLTKSDAGSNDWKVKQENIFLHHLTLQRWKAVLDVRETKEEILMRFQIPNMTCGGCANRVTNAVHSVDPKAEVKADPVTLTVTVASAEPEHRFVSVLADAGYPPER